MKRESHFRYIDINNLNKEEEDDKKKIKKF